MDVQAIAGAVTAAILFVVLLVLLATGGEVQRAILSTQDTGSATHTNDSIAFAANNTFYTLTNFPIIDVTYVGNDTLELNESTNWTHNSRQVKLTLNPWAGWGDVLGTYNVTYTYKTFSAAYNITNQTAEGVLSYAEQMPLIGTMIGLIIVLGLLLTLLVRRGKTGY